jgi:hypothetical protein
MSKPKKRKNKKIKTFTKLPENGHIIRGRAYVGLSEDWIRAAS